MPRWYIGLSDFKADLGITSTDDDATLGRAIARASRWLEGKTGRVFIPTYSANAFDAPPAGDLLWFHNDLWEVGTIADAAGNLAATDYVLEPAAGPPYAYLALTGARSWYWTTSRRQAVTITGWWGYYNELATVGSLSGSLASGATALTLAGCQVGHMLRIDDELIHVSAVGDSDALTLERGQNGTTAATHDSGTTVYRYVPDLSAQDLVAMVAAALYQDREHPGVRSRSLGPASVSYGNNGAGGVPADALNKAALLKRHV